MMSDTNNPNSKVNPQDELRDLIQVQPEEAWELWGTNSSGVEEWDSQVWQDINFMGE
jgi:hypothetical protein